MRVIVAYGTRPERIKLAPVISALRDADVEVEEWCSGQSKDLADGDTLGHSVDWGFGIITGVGDCITAFGGVIDRASYLKRPLDAVIVQGDTATAFACAQAAFLARVPVAHVEAGMRTYASEPFPEEAFRRQIGAIATWHFCPSEHEVANLVREGLKVVDDDGIRRIHEVGNTVIDTLPRVPFNVLVTLHRRENWGARISNALNEIEQFSLQLDGDSVVTIVRHPNWVGHQEPRRDSGRVVYVDPLPRESLLEYVETSALVVTDSGGLQEEAAHFGVPCLVLRSSTERTALVAAGAVTLITPDDQTVLRQALEQAIQRRRCYGRGDSAAQIAAILSRALRPTDA